MYKKEKNESTFVNYQSVYHRALVFFCMSVKENIDHLHLVIILLTK